VNPVPPSAPADRIPDIAYRRMALVLRIGLTASLLVFLGGIIAHLALHPGAAWSPTESNPSLTYLNPAGLARGLASGATAAYLTLAILLLVATPLVRVFAGLYYFERHGERTIAAIALAVFLMLLFGLFVLGPWIR